ncbi:MAG: T9SS type A sorting domain-containing protein, partial [Bacteroidota bacterium]
GVCNSSGVPYSVALVNGIAYNWSFNVGNASVASGQGTNAVTANFTSTFTSGILSVTAGNACGISASRNLTIKAAPAKPVSITGATSVCANQFGVPYSVSPVATAISYTWTGTNNSHISDGVVTSTGVSLTTTSTSVTVNFGNTSGKLNVRANNNCGTGLNQTKTVAFVCKTTGEENNVTTLELKPNPAREYVEVDYVTLLKGNGRIIICDVMGREVYKQNIVFSEGENSSRINLRGMIKGIYLLTINQDGQKLTKKLIVN